MLRAVIVVWLALLPWVLLEALPFANIAVVAIMAYLLLFIEDVAVQMEDPFGTEANDLPLEALCLTVQADVLRLLDELQPSLPPQPTGSPKPNIGADAKQPPTGAAAGGGAQPSEPPTEPRREPPLPRHAPSSGRAATETSTQQQHEAPPPRCEGEPATAAAREELPCGPTEAEAEPGP